MTSGWQVATTDDTTVGAGGPPPADDPTTYDVTQVAPFEPEVGAEEEPGRLPSAVIVFLVAFAVFVVGWALLGDVVDGPDARPPSSPPPTTAVVSSTTSPAPSTTVASPAPPRGDRHGKGNGNGKDD